MHFIFSLFSWCPDCHYAQTDHHVSEERFRVVGQYAEDLLSLSDRPPGLSLGLSYFTAQLGTESNLKSVLLGNWICCDMI